VLHRLPWPALPLPLPATLPAGCTHFSSPAHKKLALLSFLGLPTSAMPTSPREFKILGITTPCGRVHPPVCPLQSLPLGEGTRSGLLELVGSCGAPGSRGTSAMGDQANHLRQTAWQDRLRQRLGRSPPVAGAQPCAWFSPRTSLSTACAPFPQLSVPVQAELPCLPKS